MTSIDSGARCDDHAGEVFPVRCAACEAAAEEEPEPFYVPPRIPSKWLKEDG